MKTRRQRQLQILTDLKSECSKVPADVEVIESVYRETIASDSIAGDDRWSDNTTQQFDLRGEIIDVLLERRKPERETAEAWS
jgi:hypothetical protein